MARRRVPTAEPEVQPPADREDVRTPPLRPHDYTPADYADAVVHSAREAGVSPSS